MFNTRLRIAVDLLFLAAVIAVIVILLVKPFTSGSSVPSAAQVAAAERWLASRPLPRGTAIDPTGTACQFQAALCLTSDQSARALGPGLARVLRAGGASLTTEPCERLGCLGQARYRGVEIDFQTHTLSGYRTGVSSALFEIQGGPVGSSTDQRLPALGTLHLFPAGVRTSLACLDRIAGGCATQTGSLRAGVGVRTLARRWQVSLTSAGWLTNESCTHAGAVVRCQMLARRSIEPDGGRFIALVVALRQRGSGAISGKVTVQSI